VFLKAAFPNDLRLDGLKIVVDCANGAAYNVAPAALEELGAEVILLGTTPNGTNINHLCGSQHPRYAAAKVLETGADLGITLDGDADRVIMIDERGQLVDGDQIMAVCAPQMKAEKRLPKNTVVATVMTNLGLEVALARHDIKLVRTQVGDRYVVEEMKRRGLVLGGEQSGHLIFLNHATTGDGMVAALQILSVMVRTGKRLSELTSGMEAYPQRLLNVKVIDKPPLETLDTVSKAIADAEKRLGDKGRVLVRYSGTETLARVMVEGADGPLIDACADDIAAAMIKAIGA
jgi:phosphoglucosamine mutase